MTVNHTEMVSYDVVVMYNRYEKYRPWFRQWNKHDTNQPKDRELHQRKGHSIPQEREGATPGSSRGWKKEGMPAKKGDFWGGECRNVQCASKHASSNGGH